MSNWSMSRKVKASTIISSRAFKDGFRDRVSGRPLQTEYAVGSAQTRYERGRLFAVIHPGADLGKGRSVPYRTRRLYVEALRDRVVV